MEVILKVRKRGIVILPKKLRESIGLREGDVLLAEAQGDSIILRVHRPLEVDVDPRIVDRIVEEEKREERRRMGRLLEA